MASTKSRIRTGILSLGVLATLGTGLVACGGDNDGGNNNDSPTTTGKVKNMPLNACVSVMSGGRPSPGVTIPRCIPTTIAGKPFTMTTVKPNKG
jgi:hypothetical protein